MQHVSRNRQNQELAQKMNDLPNSEIRHLIAEYIHSERDRAILRRRFIDGICFEPLAEEFDLSVRQVKNIVYRGGNIIRKHARK